MPSPVITREFCIEPVLVSGRTELFLRGRLTRGIAPQAMQGLLSHLPLEAGKLAIDLGGVTYLDSAGVATLARFLSHAQERGCRIELLSLSEPARASLELFRIGTESIAKAEPIGWLERVGGRAERWVASARRLSVLMADTLWWALVGPWSPSPGAPAGEIGRQVGLLGARAVGIVALLAVLIGLTMALLAMQQLRQFGANIYVANLVAISMLREMGPLLTAVIVAGRSGSAIAAEIATMRITEEIDALETMGFSPVRFLVVPKFYAVTLTQPMLTLLANACGILGGMVIALIALQVPFYAFLAQAGGALSLEDLSTGMLKAVVFGWIILWTGAHTGLEASGGAQGVGLATTRSVVVAIFAVIVADCCFSLAFYL